MAIKKRSATVVPGASGAVAAVKNPQASKTSFWGELPQHVMSGISRMVPTLIMGGVILAFSQLIAYSWLKIPAEIGIMDALNSGKFSGFDLSLLKFAWLSQSFGGVLFGFAIPMFAAFVANSIGGKLAFPAGFIGGLMSTQPTQLLNFDPSTMQWATSSPVPSTFIGALIISIVAGYLVKWMNQKIQLPDFLLAFKTTFLLPILSAIFVMLAMYYVITPFGGWINGGIRTVLTAAGEKGALMYAMGIAAATAIDLGGPINKAAGFVAFSFTTDHVLPATARSIAIVIPPIGLGLATIIDRRLTGKRLFNAQLYPQGKTAMFLAFMGISEGAIPFALESPITAIPSYMVGAIRQNKQPHLGISTGSGYVVISRESAHILVDSRYYVEVEARAQGYQLHLLDATNTLTTIVNQIIADEQLQTLGFEGQQVSWETAHRWQSELNAKLVSATPDVLRQIKTPEEVEKIRLACGIADRGAEHIRRFIQAGMSEREIAAELEWFMRQQGAEKASFDTIVASGWRGALPHGKASDKIVAAGEFVTLDFGALYQGYCSDMTRTLLVNGEGVSAESHPLFNVYQIVLQAQLAAISAIRPGVRCQQVDDAARRVITEAGYGDYFGHNTGHAIGIEVHEDPRFSPRDTTTLQPGMLLTVEPGIYLPGQGGVRIEDVVLVTPQGAEVLYAMPKTVLLTGEA
ncbi:aminopeptidase [Escherichia coli]|nr:aminopeptidase [Escherichia coli]